MTVDVVLVTVVDTDLNVLLVRRGEPPFKGAWALPGGFVRVGDGVGARGEDLEAAARRELAEETGLASDRIYLEQLQAFGAPDRDPRGRVISVAFYALVSPDLRGTLDARGGPTLRAGSDAADARWVSLSSELSRLPLAFDHGAILEAALTRMRSRIDDSTIAFELVPPTFTVAELRGVFEAVRGEAHDPANFRRRFERMQDDGLIEVAPGKRQTGTKPARVYRFVRGGGRG
ncbi:MAG: NUDIX hydrolase [Deltaproteobacteria bacterium]|nr:NUDIX hydrolase [Deltaproteobacteria bacterium]